MRRTNDRAPHGISEARVIAIVLAVLLAACAPSVSSPITTATGKTGPASPAAAGTGPPANVTVGSAFLSDNLYRDNGREWPIGESEGASHSFDVGHGYVVRLAAAAKTIYPAPSFAGIGAEKLSDYAVDVQVMDVVSMGPQDSLGAFCRNAPPSTERYSFVIRFGTDGSETYEIWRDDRAAGAQPRKLASGTGQPSARATTKILRAVCVGGQGGPVTLIFNVDGKQVLRATDDRPPLASGRAGLLLWTGPSSTSGAKATFSFFTVSPAMLRP